MPAGVQKKALQVSVPPKKCAWLDPLRAYCAEKSGDATWGDDTAMLFRAHYDAFREECVAAKEAADKDAPPKKAADPSALGTSLGKKLTKTANSKPSGAFRLTLSTRLVSSCLRRQCSMQIRESYATSRRGHRGVGAALSSSRSS